MDMKKIGIIMLIALVFLGIYSAIVMRPESIEMKYESLHLSLRTVEDSENLGQIEQKIWFQRANENKIEFRVEQSQEENEVIDLYNYEEGTGYTTFDAESNEWYYEDLNMEDLEDMGFGFIINEYERIAQNYEIGDRYEAEDDEGEEVKWEILNLEENIEINENVFQIPENAILTPMEEFEGQNN